MQVGSMLPFPRPLAASRPVHDQGFRSELGLRSTLPRVPPAANFNQAIPTNDVAQPNYAITLLSQGNLYLTLSTDPTNPNIVYLGSFGDTVNDVAGSYNATGERLRHDPDRHDQYRRRTQPQCHVLTIINDGGAVTLISVRAPRHFTPFLETPGWLVPPFYFLDPTPYVNFIRDPQ